MENNNYLGGSTTTLLEKKSWVEEKEVSHDTSVSCFVLLEHSDAFSIDEKSYNLNILGQPMFTWVCRACPSIPVTIEAERGANPLEVIRPYLKSSEYTIVLYSDTPLLTKATINEIIEYVKTKGLNVCKLTRGYVYKTDYIKRVGEVFAPQTYYFDEEDFIMAINFKQVQIITDLLKNRIIDFHMKNGVYFTSPDLVQIDANVTIGKNTVISGASRLLGKTQVGDNCKVNSSKLVSAKLFDSVELLDATVEKSVIEQECYIGENTIITQGSLINKNTVIGKNNVIKSTSVGENVKMGDNNQIYSSRIHDLCKLGNSNILAGEDGKIIRMLTNATISSGVKVAPAVMIGESVDIASFKEIKNNVRQGDVL